MLASNKSWADIKNWSAEITIVSVPAATLDAVYRVGYIDGLSSYIGDL